MKRRTKIATILTAGLLSASLVGVGFAAWTFQQQESVDAQQQGSIGIDGDVKYEGLKDGAITMDATDTAIYLTGHKVSDSWIKYDGTYEEKLTATFTIHVVDENVDSIKLELTVNDTEDTKWAKAVTANLVVAPTVTASGTSATWQQEQNTIKVKGTEDITVTVTFGWGSELEGGPQAKFKDSGYSAETATKVEGYLNQIKELTSVKFTLKATASPAAE